MSKILKILIQVFVQQHKLQPIYPVFSSWLLKILDKGAIQLISTKEILMFQILSMNDWQKQ